MSAEDLNRVSRPIWLCRGCGHWSTSMEMPEKHITRSMGRLSAVLEIHEWKTTKIHDMPGLKHLSSVVLMWAAPSMGNPNIRYTAMERFRDRGDGVLESAGAQPTEHCEAGYERWTARRDPMNDESTPQPEG